MLREGGAEDGGEDGGGFLCLLTISHLAISM